MGDFDTTQLLSDWDNVLSNAGAVTALTGGVTFSGVWAQRADVLADMDEQLRDDKRFTIFTTFSELPTPPVVRQTVFRGSVTYFVDGVRTDAEEVGIEFDVRRII